MNDLRAGDISLIHDIVIRLMDDYGALKRIY